MQTVVAFRRTRLSEPSVVDQLNEYITQNKCRVIGFQVVKPAPGITEEWLMAIVDEK